MQNFLIFGERTQEKPSAPGTWICTMGLGGMALSSYENPAGLSGDR